MRQPGCDHRYTIDVFVFLLHSLLADVIRRSGTMALEQLH